MVAEDDIISKLIIKEICNRQKKINGKEFTVKFK